MSGERNAIFEWAEGGRLRTGSVNEALALAAATPDPADWRRFVDRLLLGAGIVLAAAGASFFVAYNWQALDRFAKFALIEMPIVGAIAVCAWRGLETTVGKVALVAAALCTGALLALVGQVYQTGADSYGLFAAWALAILVWVAVARLPVLWLLWIVLVNVAVVLYFDTFGRFFDFPFGRREMLWLLFGVDTAALVLWEILAAAGVAWLRERWAVRVLVAASGIAITALAAWSLAEKADWSIGPLVAFGAWLFGVWWHYRRRTVDLFVLAGAALSFIVVVTTWLAGLLLDRAGAGGLFVIGVVVIAGAALSTWWLRGVAAEERA